MSDPTPTSLERSQGIHDLNTAVETLEVLNARIALRERELQALDARQSRVLQQLSKVAWVGPTGRPENFADERVADIRVADKEKAATGHVPFDAHTVEIPVADVVDPPVPGAALSEAKREGRTDLLTRLVNNVGFAAYLRSFARRQAMTKAAVDAPLMLINVDLVGQKHFNDDYTYKTGSDVLTLIGHSLAEGLDRTGLSKPELGSFILARTGGDEFFVVGQRQLDDRAVRQYFKVVKEIFDGRLKEFVAEQEAAGTLEPNKRRPGTSLGEDNFALRYGYNVLAHAPGVHTSGEILDTVADQIKTSEFEVAEAKFDMLRKAAETAKQKALEAGETVELDSRFEPPVDDRETGSTQFDDQRHSYLDRGHGNVRLYGEGKVVDVRSELPKSYGEVRTAAQQTVEQLHLDSAIARAPESISISHQL